MTYITGMKMYAPSSSGPALLSGSSYANSSCGASGCSYSSPSSSPISLSPESAYAPKGSGDPKSYNF